MALFNRGAQQQRAGGAAFQAGRDIVVQLAPLAIVEPDNVNDQPVGSG